MKTTLGIVQPLEPKCKTCSDGTMPTEYRRTGQCSYVCNDCGHDVSIAVYFLSDAEGMK